MKQSPATESALQIKVAKRKNVMTSAPPSDRLDRIEAILEKVAASQERTQERLNQVAESQQQTQETLDRVATQQEQFQLDLAVTREIADANTRSIQAWEQRLEAERDQTIGVEVDMLNALSDIQEGQAGLRTEVKNLNTYVRRGFDILGQALVELREEMQIGFGSMSELLQKLIDEVKVNSGRITRLEDME